MKPLMKDIKCFNVIFSPPTRAIWH